MNVEQTDCPSMFDATPSLGTSTPVRSSIKTRFPPIAEYESSIFATLRAKEHLAEAEARSVGHKYRLPRFSLLRGEVALLAERVFKPSRGTA